MAFNMFKKKNKQTAKGRGTGKGGGKAPEQSDLVQTISKIKNSRDNLEKRVDFLRKKAGRHVVLAKECMANKKKDEALMNLRRKKVYEKEIATLESSILTIEEQILKIESGSVHADIFQTLELCKVAMNKVTRGVDPDKLQDLLAELAEKNADMEEIQEIMAEQSAEHYDDAELLLELEDLDGEGIEQIAFEPESKLKKEEEELLRELRKSSAELSALAELIVPTHTPVINKPMTDEEKELAALEAQFELA